VVEPAGRAVAAELAGVGVDPGGREQLGELGTVLVGERLLELPRT